MQRGWLERARAYCVVLTVIVAGLVYRQTLNRTETDVLAPLDEHSQRGDVDDAEIVVPQQREQRSEHAGNAILGREVHEENDEAGTANAGAVTSSTFFFQAEDGIRDVAVTGVQTCALPI